MKCSNCEANAVYTIAPAHANKVHYCSRDLPDYLRLGALEGLYPVEVPPSSKKKSTTTPEEKTE